MDRHLGESGIKKVERNVDTVAYSPKISHSHEISSAQCGNESIRMQEHFARVGQTVEAVHPRFSNALINIADIHMRKVYFCWCRMVVLLKPRSLQYATKNCARRQV